ncbi:hypothetical protein DRH29_05945 [candidate division Kazan bacterium]|uniref:Uncharacterized protein n=1 Tax=candidate division Kazan bacterium TaxID=2202143 RepID=A0A420ZAQ5_UNCK3|nr:MAG: hypothetical protein DRH29_05945 [candidate division Kazan bacterium]
MEETVKEERLIKKIEAQAKKFKLRIQKGRGDEKRHDAVRPDEQKWMWTAHHDLGWSLAKIGSIFNRDPRTVQKAIAAYKPTGQKKQPPGEATEPPLGFDQGQWTSLTEMIEKGLLLMVGQNIAAQLATLEPRVMRSFGCHEIGLKHLQHALSLYPSRQFDVWVNNIQEVESALLRRKAIQEQILSEAKSGCKSLGSIELVDNNFALAAYHFLARGDNSWLENDRIQTLELGPLGSWCPRVWCPLCDYNLHLQQWDTRQFICPGHNVPLISREDASPIGVVYAPEVEMELYRELVTPVEDIAMKYPSKVALSVRIPKMLPFSEVVIAVGDVDSLPKLKALIQGFLGASPLRQEAQQNEVSLQRSYTSLLETLRSALATEAK